METYNTTEFVLPGVEINPVNRIKTALMLEFSLSKATNSRNLEHYTYGIWHRTLDDLIADNGQLSVIPQYMLWYLPRNNNHDDDDDDEDETEEDEPGDTTDENGRVDNGDTKSKGSKASTEDDETAGDLSLVSIAATVAQDKAKEVLPDFAIIFYRYRTIQDGPRMRYKLRYFGVPILAEQKRPPRRSLVHDEAYYERVDDLVWKAKVAVNKQAAHLFRMHTAQTQTLTFACSGRYWSYRIVQRQTVIHFASDGDDDYEDKGSSDDEEDEEGEEEETEEDDEDREENDDDRDVGDLSGFLEPVVSDDELKYPNEWSRILKINTPASNQHLCLIWAYVNSINDANRTMG